MAHRYLCPICDQELTGMHYCKACRKWIKEPVIFHGDSLPNERSYRDYSELVRNANQRQRNMSAYNRSYGRPEDNLPYDKCHPSQKAGRYGQSQSRSAGNTVLQGGGRAYSSRSTASRKGKSGGGVVTAVIFIWILIVFFISFLGAIL